MDLNKLTNKLKEIPFENWEIKETHSEWNEYVTKINDKKIKIKYLPPQDPRDDMIVKLDIISSKNETLVEGITPPGIYGFVLDLQHQEIKKLAEQNYQYEKKKYEKNQKNLSEFLNSI